ncbi:MAG: helix-turn-helix domain-containing protein [Monoglobaceae bacterium]
MTTELKFQSSLSEKEIEQNFESFDFFSSLMSGLNEALAYEKGEATAKTFARKSALPSVDVAAIRISLNMTQKNFANILGVSPRTVESWECGRTTPTPTAKKLIYLIANDHSLVAKLK